MPCPSATCVRFPVCTLATLKPLQQHWSVRRGLAGMRRQNVHVATHGHDDLQVPDWSKDNAAGRRILEHNGAQVFEVPGFRLEGGSIHTDGQGTLIATEQCLLHPSRNPDLGRPGIEAASPACVPSSFPASGSLSMCHAAVSRPLSVVRPLAPGIAAHCAHSTTILFLAAYPSMAPA